MADTQNYTIDFVDPPAAQQNYNIDFVDQPKAADSLYQDFRAGYQDSSAGLAFRGKLPDVVLDQTHAAWYDKLATSAGKMLGDFPAMVVGGLAGAVEGIPGGPVGAAAAGGAGMFALPTAIREAYVQAYEKGEVKGWADFLGRTSFVLKETGKSAITGAATLGAGNVVGKLAAPVMSPIAATSARMGTELGAMTITPALLNGEAPDPQDAVNAAIMMVGMKGAGMASDRMMKLWKKAGVMPQQVVKDAMADPTIARDLAAENPAPKPAEGVVQTDLFGKDVYYNDPEIPKAYVGMSARQAAMDTVDFNRAKQFAESPFSAEFEPYLPTELKLQYTRNAEDAQATIDRVVGVYKDKIQEQRRDVVSWDKTRQGAVDILKGLADDPRTMDEFLNRTAGTPAGDAEILARRDLAIGAAERLSKLSKDYVDAGGDAAATPEQKLQYYAEVELASANMATFLGARAETGRALNALKITSEAADRAKYMQDILDTYAASPEEMARRLADMDNPAAVRRFVRESMKATKWEQFIEGWKASLVSRISTHAANIGGNIAFYGVRGVSDVGAAVLGAARRSPDRVAFSDLVAANYGGVRGLFDGMKIGAAILRHGVEYDPKLDVHKKAIPGKVGETIRLPFRALSAEDAVFNTMNQRYTLYDMASKQARSEGFNPLTKEYRQRVSEIVDNPTDKMTKAADEAAARYTFTAPLGEKGRAVNNMVKKWHLELFIPFVSTPGNIFKELTKLTPAAPILSEWREQVAKGGADADRAVAAVVVGSALAWAVKNAASDGSISGAGDPDPNKKRVDLASGWQPYSFKIDCTWYNYQRFAPIGTLMGMAADIAEVEKHMTPEESDKAVKMLAVAFSNAVTKQTFMQGMATVTDALAEPDRFGPRLAQSLTASLVPGFIAEQAAMHDPYVREINSIVDAVKNRIPGVRESLPPGIDVFGESIQSKERLGVVSPVTTTRDTEDKVRAEASRLRISVAKTPKDIILPAAGDRQLGKVDLTHKQQHRFAQVAGKMAHQQMTELVNSPFWDTAPDTEKRMAFDKVFDKSREFANKTALTPEQRQFEMTRISKAIQAELAKPPGK